jgi:hypothetical protein
MRRRCDGFPEIARDSERQKSAGKKQTHIDIKKNISEPPIARFDFPKTDGKNSPVDWPW